MLRAADIRHGAIVDDVLSGMAGGVVGLLWARSGRSTTTALSRGGREMHADAQRACVRAHARVNGLVDAHTWTSAREGMNVFARALPN